MAKPTICLDFDGVIHSYEKGWHNGQIYGTVVSGFFEWAETVKNDYTLVVYSSRSTNIDQRRQMVTWLWYRYLEWSDKDNLIPVADEVQGDNDEIKSNIQEIRNLIKVFDHLFTFASEKPPAYLTIDDRCVCFTGDWNAPELLPQALKDFKSWTERG